MGNYLFPSLKTAYMAPGHNSAIKDEDGKYYLVYHQRFDNGSEYHEPRVHQMFLNQDGWFVAAAFAFGYLPYTLIVMLCNGIFIGFNLHSVSFNVVTIFIGFALLAYIKSFFYYKVFMKHIDERYDDFL